MALLCSVCTAALAQAPSPLSLRYAPARGLALATTSVGMETTDAQLRSALLNDDGRSRYALVSQSLDYGITDSLTASVTEVYANAYEQNPMDIAKGRAGFRSPKFQLSAWTPLASLWRLKSSTGLQFNPSNSSRLNYAFVAGDVLFLASPGQTLSMGLTYTAHKDIGSHSTSWRGEWESSWDIYQLRLKHTQSLLAGFGSTLGPYESSRYKSWEIELGRPIAADMWASLGYVSERNQFRWVQAPWQIGVSSQRQMQRLTASLKWVWN